MEPGDGLEEMMLKMKLLQLAMACMIDDLGPWPEPPCLLDQIYPKVERSSEETTTQTHESL